MHPTDALKEVSRWHLLDLQPRDIFWKYSECSTSGKGKPAWSAHHPEKESRECRLDERRKPHASFNNGISSIYSSEEASDKRLCTSLFSESEVSLCLGLLLDVPATQEDVVA